MARKIMLTLCVIILMAQSVVARSENAPKPKSEEKALRYSLYGTLIPTAVGAGIFFTWSDRFSNRDDKESIIGASLAGLGIIFGPSLGHIYAGEPRYLRKGFLIRGLTASLVIGGVAWASAGDSDSNGAAAVLPAGIILTSATYDIVKTRQSVRKYNSQHGFSKIRLSPTYFADQGAPGVMLSVGF